MSQNITAETGWASACYASIAHGFSRGAKRMNPFHVWFVPQVVRHISTVHSERQRIESRFQHCAETFLRIEEAVGNMPKPSSTLQGAFGRLPKPSSIIQEAFGKLPKPSSVIQEAFGMWLKPSSMTEEIFVPSDGDDMLVLALYATGLF